MAERRSHLILVGLILAALAGVALLVIPGSPAHKKTTLGLDLQGGLEVVLRASPPPGTAKLPPGALDRSVTVIRNRIDKLGVSEPLVTKQGSNEIVVELAGVHNVQDAINIIGKTAQLELYDLETSVTGPSATATGQIRPTQTLYGLLAGVQSLTKQQEPSAWYLFTCLGFYPVCPASDYYVIGAPQLPKIVLHLSNGKDWNIQPDRKCSCAR